MRRVIVVLLSLSLVGCATTTPYIGQGPHPQIARGKPVPPIDVLGNILALPFKLMLLSWKFNLHRISPSTEDTLRQYLTDRDLPGLRDTRFQLNMYNPGEDLSRLIHNKHIAWPYRLLLGLPTTLIYDVLLPGRIIPFGDYYNPFTNTVHIFSDNPAILLHEAGHAYDFATRRYQGSYALIRMIPFGIGILYQESEATGEALRYLRETDDHKGEVNAYKILYPAYGTYVGSIAIPVAGNIIGAVAGHVVGRSKAAMKARYYEKLERNQAQHSEPDQPQQPTSSQLDTHGEMRDTAPVPANPEVRQP